MKKKIAALAIAGASLGLFATASPAGAAHCSDGEAPGFSYFGTENTSAGTNEGTQGDGSSGASACRATGSPSNRAPGQNR
jgi:hypothetical protein